MSWATDNRREDGAGSIVSGESGLAHTGTIVDYKGGNIVVTHFLGRFLLLLLM